MRNAVIVVHGISPQPRYGIQDLFASGLRDALENETPTDRAARMGDNAPAAVGTWSTGVAWPAVCKGQALEESPAVALRVECKDARGQDVPGQPSIDVFEGYWSPIDKEETTPLRVLSWLFQSFFTPLSQAKIPASIAKLGYDLFCSVAALAFGLGVTILLACSGWRAYQLNRDLVWHDPIRLIVQLFGAYLLAQVAARLLAFVTMRAPIAWWGAGVLALMTVTGLWLLGYPLLGAKPEPFIVLMTGPLAWLLYTALSLRALFGFIRNFLVDTIGDIQIYTTHDENARFNQFRTQIIQAVGDVISRVLRSTDDHGAPLYDKVFLAGHSLGTTILMDVLVALHEQVEEEGLPVEAWRRIRAFLTFGTALEKTRFFFDVRNPGLSKTLIDWRRDIYGHLFTAQASVLDGAAPGVSQKPDGIYWENYWYFTDVVANAIVSYESTRVPGEDLTKRASLPDHAICVNASLKAPLTLWPHSHYLHDDAFWHTGEQLGAAAIVAHG